MSWAIIKKWTNRQQSCRDFTMRFYFYHVILSMCFFSAIFFEIFKTFVLRTWFIMEYTLLALYITVHEHDLPWNIIRLSCSKSCQKSWQSWWMGGDRTTEPKPIPFSRAAHRSGLNHALTSPSTLGFRSTPYSVPKKNRTSTKKKKKRTAIFAA